MKAYKYLKREYALALIEKGSLLVTTLHECRNIEKRGSEQGDSTEGKITEQQEQLMICEGLDLEINTGINANIDSADMYIYCMSKCYSKQSMKRMGYDTCVEISDLDNFINLLKGKLPDVTYRGCYPCVYNEEKIIAQNIWAKRGTLKPKIYKYQDEIRAIWSIEEFEKFPIEPKVISVPEIKSLCRILQKEAKMFKEICCWLAEYTNKTICWDITENKEKELREFEQLKATPENLKHRIFEYQIQSSIMERFSIEKNNRLIVVMNFFLLLFTSILVLLTVALVWLTIILANKSS